MSRSTKSSKSPSTPASEAGAPQQAGAASNLEIYEAIFDAISDRRLPPGTKLSEEKLATAFDVSRTRIREVLFRLDQERIVNLLPNRGAFVASPSVEETHEVFEARRAIEDAVIRLVCANLSQEKIERLRQHQLQEASARKRNDRVALARLTGDFHVLLAEVAGNRFFLETMRRLVALSRMIIYLYDTPSASSSACAEHEHEDIIDAICDGNAKVASTLLAKHLKHIENSLELNRQRAEEVDFQAIFRGGRQA